MKNEQTNNGYTKDPYEGLLDSGPENDLAPEGEALDLFWHFKDEADLNPNTPRIDKFLKQAWSMVLDHIERNQRYELEALHFATTKELLMWIRRDDDRIDWAWSNRTYRRMLEETNQTRPSED